MKPHVRTILPAIVLLLAGACATVSDPHGIVLDVPFVPQKPDQCGTAALEMVLRHLGRPADSSEIEEKVFVPVLRGATPELLADAARSFGLHAEKTSGDLPFLQRLLAGNTAPIIFLGPDAGQTNGHFVVVTGIEKRLRDVRIHSGTNANIWVDSGKFIAMWKRGNYTTVVVEKR